MNIFSVSNVGNTTYARTPETKVVQSNSELLFTPIQRTKTDKLDKIENKVPPEGTTDSEVLAQAPSPKKNFRGNEICAKFVINVSQNILYKYDKDGNPVCAYRVATGKKSTPTTKGVCQITYTDTYPYSKAPAGTKRRRIPGAFGPKIIYINMIDPKTGEKRDLYEWIHGNGDYSSLGTYASGGCIRMDNDVIKKLAAEVKSGEYVIIQ